MEWSCDDEPLEDRRAGLFRGLPFRILNIRLSKPQNKELQWRLWVIDIGRV